MQALTIKGLRRDYPPVGGGCQAEARESRGAKWEAKRKAGPEGRPFQTNADAARYREADFVGGTTGPAAMRIWNGALFTMPSTIDENLKLSFDASRTILRIAGPS
jgi:hypothetical protein